LDFFFVLVRRLVHLVVVSRLKEEVTDLAGGHRHEPADQRCYGRILKHHHIGGQKAYGAYQMQRLVDPAVMVITVVVPTLHSQGFEKALHISSPCCTRMSRLWRFDESDVTDVRPRERQLGRGEMERSGSGARGRLAWARGARSPSLGEAN